MPRKREGTAFHDKADGRWIIQFPMPDGTRSKPRKLGPEVTTRERAKEIAKAGMERAAREGTKRDVIGPKGESVDPRETVSDWAER